jgi:nitrite reductase (NO-forming)
MGIWLPLHLSLTGAVSVAISGAMQMFSITLTATPDPSARLVWTQFVLVNSGTAAVVGGRMLGSTWLTATGGSAFVASAMVLGWLVWRAWRRGLNRRHLLPIRMYGFAITCVVVGGTFGALLGGGAIHDPAAYVALKDAHMTTNVLGWVSITIAATLVTLLPTVLRIHIPAWHGTWVAGLLAAGVILLASGLALRFTVMAAVGGVMQLCGALGVALLVVIAARTPRRWPAPLAALHLMAGVIWFAVGSGALAISAIHGVDGFDVFRAEFLTMFVGGWILQVLLGAWLYLLPMQRPALPDDRRAGLVAIESAAWLEVGSLNGGIAIVTASGAGWIGPTAGSVGAFLALGGGGLALLKAWTFHALGEIGVSDARGRSVWMSAREGWPGSGSTADVRRSPPDPAAVRREHEVDGTE